MTADLKLVENELKQLKAYASINLDYHQAKMARYTVPDRTLKVILGVAAVVGFMLSAIDYGMPAVPPAAGASAPEAIDKTLAAWGLALGLLSSVIAVLVNVIPLDRWEQDHAKLCARWAELHGEVSGLLLRLKLALPDDELSTIAVRLIDLTERRNTIEIDEPRPDRKLMDWAQENENERNWGVRAQSEVEKLAAARLASSQPPPPANQQLVAAS